MLAYLQLLDEVVPFRERHNPILVQVKVIEGRVFYIRQLRVRRKVRAQIGVELQWIEQRAIRA